MQRHHPERRLLFLGSGLGFIYECGDLVHLNLGHGTAGVVNTAQLGCIALHGADLQRDGRADDEGFARLFQHGNMGKGLVVALMAVGHGIHEGRIAQVTRPDGGQHLVFLLHKALGLGQHDQVALVADGLKEPHRDGICNAAVQQLVVADLHDL